MQRNAHISSLGYRLESTQDATLVKPLLSACHVSPIEEDADCPSEYLMASTQAGGIAACVGWTRLGDEAVVIHSLAVAPPSRGSGVGASLLSSALAFVMDGAPVEAIYLEAEGARRFFSLFGFISLEADEVPSVVREHDAFERAVSDKAQPMVRHYQITPRGLDQCAFRLLENEAGDGVLPPGAVIFFKQTGQMIEAAYRGGPVRRGHILGRVEQDEIVYRWHAYTDRDEIVHGSGELVITSLDDGRRQLQERSVFSGGSGLLMREV